MAFNFIRDPALIEIARNSYCPCLADWRRELTTEADDSLAHRLHLLIGYLEAEWLVDEP